MTEIDPTAAETTPPAPEAPAPPASAPTAPVAAPQSTPRRSRGQSGGGWYLGTGRRKTSVARVRVKPGSGTFVVNKRPHDKYFTAERDQNDLMRVLETTKTSGAMDVQVNVSGGGITGQAGAIVLGLARALRQYDETLDPVLRDHNFLTRDPRKVERKKYGQPGARARFQFSKR